MAPDTCTLKTKQTFTEYILAVVREDEQVTTTSLGQHRAPRSLGMLTGSSGQSAMTDSKDNDTSAQSQAERDKTVAANEGGSVRTTVEVGLL